MAKRLWMVTSGTKYSEIAVAESAEEAAKSVQDRLRMPYLLFKARPLDLPGYIVTIRGENEVDAGTDTAGDWNVQPAEPERAAEPEREPEQRAEPATPPAAVAQRRAKTSNGKGRRGR